jgi:3-methylfumaryl-CoA hydratase
MTDHRTWDEWIGRSVTARDTASAAPVANFFALLDRSSEDGAFLPPLAHWLYFLPLPRQSELGSDGHPKLGVFLPDLGLPRRMWAGSRIRFHRPIAVGTLLTRRTTIRSISLKQGSTGTLGFITLTHEISTGDELLVSEEQDLVYRQAAGTAGVQAKHKAARPEELATGEILARKRFDAIELFRFSALTGNMHRIHYDVDYARDVEGYAGLVVHGPFQAMVLMDQYRRSRPCAQITSFEFRATAPLFAGEEASFCVNGDDPATLRVYPLGREPSMTATIHAAVCASARTEVLQS